MEHGFSVYGADASPRMIAALRANFPAIPVECAAAEDSGFFGLTFDGVIAWAFLSPRRESPARINRENRRRLAERWQIAVPGPTP